MVAKMAMGIPAPTIEEIIAHDREHDCRDVNHGVCVRVRAVANLPSRFGEFQIVAFETPDGHLDHAALVKGDVTDQHDVPVRLHSECLTGDAFASLRCDCREQLEAAMQQLAEMERGVIVYLRQEGRGIGFANKIRAYQLQEAGYDTNQANELLGFAVDERDYAIAAHILFSLKVKSVQLISNNPLKIKDLREHGVEVRGRIPIVIAPNPHNVRYLETKREKSGHLLGNPPVAVVPEQVDDAREARMA